MSDIEALARTITHDRMVHYGYTAAGIAATEAPPDHSECELTEYGWECADENGKGRHPDHLEADQTAEFVMFVLEHPAVAALTAERDRLRRDVSEAAEVRAKDRAQIQALCEEQDHLRAERDRLREQVALWKSREDVARVAAEEARAERDLAIAHDRQPYPTAEA
jgi:hypothetical protein